jgi:hypothetical protein
MGAQLAIVVLIVLLAGIYVGRRFLRQFHVTEDEPDACSHCPALQIGKGPPRPPSQPLSAGQTRGRGARGIPRPAAGRVQGNTAGRIHGDPAGRTRERGAGQNVPLRKRPTGSD